MNKKERAECIQKILNRYFPSPKIPLKHTSHYTLLVAVVLSAQCTDERVNQITPRLFALANTPEKMMHLDVEEIATVIRPCGIAKNKAKALFALSQILVEKYEGKVPDNFEDLISLPGVGRKTASVVLCQAFHKPAFPVDTHVLRCANRWALSKEKTPEKVEEDLKKIFPKKSWIKLHLQIILFARKYCPARGHEIKNCPICCLFNAVAKRHPH